MIKTEKEFYEVLHLLEGDINTLFKLVFTHRKPVTEADVRIASVILRKWLVEGLLGRFCHTTGSKATFFAMDNSAPLLEIPKQPSVNYFLTGGIKFNGTPFCGIFNSTLPYDGRPLIQAAAMQEKEFSLASFIGQKRLYFEGTYFTCEDIIKFMANKAGGAHFDTTRKPHFEKLERAAQFMKYGGPAPSVDWEPDCEIYLVLEPSSDEVLTALHIEIVAAATSFIQLRIEGTPMVRLTTKSSVRTRLRCLFKPDRPRYRIFGTQTSRTNEK